jgi:hypothetical protein
MPLQGRAFQALKRSMMRNATGQQNEDINGRWANQITGPGADPVEDPLGINLQARGMAHRAAYDQAEWERNPYAKSGPLPNPMWEGFHQALQERGVDRLVGGASPAGSHQLTGQNVQPNYFSTGATFTNPRTQVTRPIGARSTAGDYETVLRRQMELARQGLQQAMPGRR